MPSIITRMLSFHTLRFFQRASQDYTLDSNIYFRTWIHFWRRDRPEKQRHMASNKLFARYDWQGRDIAMQYTNYESLAREMARSSFFLDRSSLSLIELLAKFRVEDDMVPKPITNTPSAALISIAPTFLCCPALAHVSSKVLNAWT